MLMAMMEAASSFLPVRGETVSWLQEPFLDRVDNRGSRLYRKGLTPHKFDDFRGLTGRGGPSVNDSTSNLYVGPAILSNKMKFG